MNKILTEQDILEYLNEGWNFRCKNVKKYTYITRRKGQKEVSLGRYSKAQWLLIQNAKKSFSQLSKSAPRLFSSDIFTELDHDFSIYRAIEKFNLCIFRDVEYFCRFWEWNERLPFFKKLEMVGLSVKKIEPSDQSKFSMWIHRASIYVCKDCVAFRSEKDPLIRFLKSLGMSEL
jgi:hypothetical protein